LGARQGHPGGVGCSNIGRWVLWGDDDEVSGRDTLRGVSVRCPGAPLTLASRSVGVRFFGRWVLGVGCWALGARQGHPRGVGSATRPLCGDFGSPFGSPDRALHDGMVGVAISAL
jgi:hypothetical protein